jgi:hypothetical protein
MEKGALAHARGSHDGKHFTLLNVEVNAFEHMELFGPAHEGLAKLLNMDE